MCRLLPIYSWISQSLPLEHFYILLDASSFVAAQDRHLKRQTSRRYRQHRSQLPRRPLRFPDP